MITLPIYDFARKYSDGNKYYDQVGVSLISSVIMSLFIYPLDTAKRCMQLNGARGHNHLYNNSWECLQSLFAKRCLYRGIHLYAFKEFFVAFAQIGIYEGLYGNCSVMN